MSGAVRAGGLVADNQGSVTDSYTTAFVIGEGLVAGLVANNQGTVSRSYVAGSVSEAGRSGSFAGSSPGGIADSYAAGSVSEAGRSGSFAGSSPGGIADSYAAGSVSGTGQHGSFAGSSQGSIVNSYVAGLPRVNGGSVPFVADDTGRGSDFLRTLQQLRCPTAPGRACAGRSTYSGWSAETWFFGDHRTLPVLRGFETPGKPLHLLAKWKIPVCLVAALGTSIGRT